jgi:hypothetical protein
LQPESLRVLSSGQGTSQQSFPSSLLDPYLEFTALKLKMNGDKPSYKSASDCAFIGPRTVTRLCFIIDEDLAEHQVETCVGWNRAIRADDPPDDSSIERWIALLGRSESDKPSWT